MLEIKDNEGVVIFPPVTTKFIDILIENLEINISTLKEVKTVAGNHPSAVVSKHYFSCLVCPFTDNSINWQDPQNIIIARFYGDSSLDNNVRTYGCFVQNSLLYIPRASYSSDLSKYTSVKLTVYVLKGA